MVARRKEALGEEPTQYFISVIVPRKPHQIGSTTRPLYIVP